MKSIEQRDLYAAALDAYRTEVPVEQWSRYGRALSKSGLEKEIQKRGYPSFERKRLDSAACKPIFQEMAAVLTAWLDKHEPEKEDGQIEQQCSAIAPQLDPSVKRLQREVERLEKELKNAQRREHSSRQRCALLEARLEAIEQQHDAFEQHCTRSLKTLHV